MTNQLIEYGTFQSKVEKYECKCQKLDVFYGKADSRCWTAIINPNKENLFVTYHINRYDIGDSSFDVLSSEKILLEIDPEDIYQTVELLLK
jgi:hypothetical protein